MKEAPAQVVPPSGEPVARIQPAATPTPASAPQPTAMAKEPPRPISPEKGAADRGQGFRDKLNGTGPGR